MTSPILLIARQEFTLNRRNKWVVSFAGIFALLTLLISYFGMVTSGYAGFQDFARTSTSLINLSGFIIPLFSLLLGVFSFISNQEYLELMVAQPVTRFQIIIGKYLGLLFTLIGATILGFSVPGVIIALMIGTEGALGYATVILFSLFLGIIFTGCAVLISQIFHRQQIALGVAIGVWVFFEIVYGLLILGTTLYFTPQVLKYSLIFSLLGNPVDITRVLSLISIGGLEFFGPAGVTLFKLAGSPTMAMLYGMIGLILWIIFPVFLSIKIFSHQNL